MEIVHSTNGLTTMSGTLSNVGKMFIGIYQPRIDGNDFQRMIQVLEISFGLNYTNPKSANYQKAKLTFGMLHEKGYSKQDFEIILKKFIETCKFPTWTPSDFLNIERPELYSFSKVLEMSNGTTQGFKPCKLENKVYWIEEKYNILPPLQPVEPDKREVKTLIPDYNFEPPVETIEKLKNNSILQKLNLSQVLNNENPKAI